MVPSQTVTLYTDIYTNICNCIKNDSVLSELLSGVVLDFDLADTAPPPVQPRDVPRIYVLPNNVEYTGDSSCSCLLHIDYSIVLEGFHVRDRKFSELAWCLMRLLRFFPFTSILVDGNVYGVLCTPGAGNWEYEPSRQTMTHQIGLGIDIRV